MRKQFGQHAEKYRKSVTHGNKAVLDHIVELISPGCEEIALDVGCGGGHMAVALAPWVRDIVAVDVTPEMLSQTSLLAAENQLSNIIICLCDTRQLPFRDEVFNVVSCRTVLHHVSEAGRAVGEMCRVMKKRGRLFIQDILGSEDQEARDYMDVIEKLRDPSHIKDYNLAEWDRFIAGAGLRVTYMETMSGIYGLKEWTTRSGTSLERIDEIIRMLERMPQRVSSHLKASYSGGDWSVEMRYILLVAAKEPGRRGN